MNLLRHFTYDILTDPEMIKLAGHDVRSAYKVSVEKPERKTLLGKPKHRCNDNILLKRILSFEA
jgi:hypothetical protein